MEKLREEGDHACTEIDGETVYMEDMIMEHVLGRKLQDNETVFHHNGNTLDNQKHNLYVWPNLLLPSGEIGNVNMVSEFVDGRTWDEILRDKGK